MNILVIAFFTTCGQTDQGDCGVRLPKIISDTMWTDRVLPGQQHIHTHSHPAVTWQPGADHMVKAGQVSWQLCREWPQPHNTRVAKKKKKLCICIFDLLSWQCKSSFNDNCGYRVSQHNVESMEETQDTRRHQGDQETSSSHSITRGSQLKLIQWE